MHLPRQKKFACSTPLGYCKKKIPTVADKQSYQIYWLIFWESGKHRNDFLLISSINSNEHNFQKWRYKGYRPQKFGQCLPKIWKTCQSTSFCFLSLIPLRSFQNIDQKSVSNSGNFAETVTLFSGQGHTGKKYNWTLVYFVTHLLHQGHKWCRFDSEMANLEDFWVHWKCPKVWPPQKAWEN